MKFIKSNKLLTVLFFLAILGVSLKLFLIQVDPDMWWHIRLGQEIVNGQWINNFTITCTDYTWINYSAFTDVVFYVIHNLFGFVGLYILVALTTFAAALVSINTLSFLHKKPLFQNKIFSLIFLIVFGFFVTPTLAVRPQVFNILFLSILLNWLFRMQLREVGSEKLEVKHSLSSVLRLHSSIALREYVIWGFVFILWVNVHGGFISGLFLIGLFIVFNLYKLTFGIFEKKYSEIKESFIRVKSLALLVVVILIVSIANPFGILLWQEILTAITSSLNTTYISEWQPINLKYFLMTSYFLFLGSTLILFAFNTKKKIINLLLLVLFGYLSVNSTRYMVVALPIVLVVFFDELLHSQITKVMVREINAEKRLKLFVNVMFSLFIIALSIINIAGVLSLAHSWNTDLPNLAQNSKYPYFAVEFIKAHPEINSKVIYNTYFWGGFLDYIYPEKKWFIDGRMSAWSCQGKVYPSILEDAVLLYWLRDKWTDVVAAYNIEVFFVEKNTYLANVLPNIPGWQMVYSDDVAVIFVKNK